MPESIQRSHPGNVFVQIPMAKRSTFLITHSCSPVNYTTTGFSSRNKDEFPQQLLDVILRSDNAVLKAIISGKKDPNAPSPGHRTASKKFLGSKFLNDMNKLTK